MIGYHVWNYDITEETAKILGFCKRDGYYDKYVESQMTKDYIKIY